ARVTVARDEIDAGRRDGGGPVVDGGLHPLLVRLGDEGAVVVEAERREGPAVVGARLQHVELGSSHLTMLGRPDLPRVRIHRGTLVLSMPIGEDLGQRTRLVHEGVVWRDAPVVEEPHGLSRWNGQILNY